MPRKRIAIFDHEVTERSPSGSCNLRLLEELCGEFDFTVFATAFTNPNPARIRWVRVPAIRRPLVARYLSYYAGSTAKFTLDQVRQGSYDLVQTVEGYTRESDIGYIHFCHRAYLRRAPDDAFAGGVRGAVRRLDHTVRAAGERRSLKVPRLLVVPSPGLRDELEEEHRIDPSRIRVVNNPLQLARFARSADFARDRTRARLETSPEETLLVFVALGHFERKGLPELLEALSQADAHVRLAVVGGTEDLVRAYRARADRIGVSSRVSFVGMQDDVRPFLWAADAYASPSAYETFSLGLHQAAAAGLPLVVMPLRGVASFFRDGVHGLAITRDPRDIATALNAIAQMDPERRRAMGTNAQSAVADLDVPKFADAWRAVYREALPA